MSGQGGNAVVDRWVAAVTGAISLVGLAAAVTTTTVDPGSGLVDPVPSALGWALGGVTVALQAVMLRWRRTSPAAVLLVVALGLPLCALWGLADMITLAQPAVLVAAYTLVLQRTAGRSWPTLLLAVVVAGSGATVVGLRGDDSVSPALGQGLLQGVGTIGVALLVAIVVGARREVGLARETRAAALERERAALVQVAVAHERTAMARELHDIAAHHLSGIAVMTAAIGTQIDTDPEGAKAAVAQVRRQSTAVLRDLRSLVGLLRETDARAADPDHVRPEALAGVAALVEDAAAVGREVDLTVLGGRGALGGAVGPLAQLAAYRMVQEALANAARHAPGARTEVIVDDRRADAVLVKVRNARAEVAPSAPGSGFGLVGMRERADLTGGTMEAGPTADGGWLVSMRLPREAALDDVPESEDA